VERKRRISWSRKLPSSIALRDGRTIATQAQARDFVLTLPALHQRNGHWQYAAMQLLKAAADTAAVGPAHVQMKIALRAEGLL
jgi:hypothetical protein